MSEADPALLDGAIHPREALTVEGHTDAIRFLLEAQASGKLHHAFLIEGPEGIGKATLAFRFAKHLIAHLEPLDVGPSLPALSPADPVHHQVASGASHNLVHLTRPFDEKAGRLKQAITIDEVRRIGRFFGQTSGNGNWRIVIVDTADDLNRNAANAILKMLEEPPQRAMFFVLSANPGRLLPTIRSRCMPLRLRPLSDADLSAALVRLGITLKESERARILEGAGGSVARAIKLINYGGLDLITAFDGLLTAKPNEKRLAMHKLAEALTGKDRDVAFDFFIEHAGDHVVRMARNAALAGDSASADRFSRLASTIGERVVVADAYNLDRKQTILSLLADIA